MQHDSFAGSKTRHGTPSGFSKHQKLKEAPCEACRAAKAEYDARLRAADSKTLASRRAAKAQGRALQALRTRYPLEYRELYEQAKRLLAAEDRTVGVG